MGLPERSKTNNEPNPNSPESKATIQVGIFDETDPLKTVALWGPVGAEAVIAKHFPPDQSLFLDNMDVLKAREEATQFIDQLEQLGVQVFTVRDQLAPLIPDRHAKEEEIRTRLHQKLDHVAGKYSPFSNLDITHDHDAIDQLFNEDVQMYGSQDACDLNYALSLARRLPLGDAMYARDQMNYLLDRRVKSSMAKPIRKPEVSLYEMVYKKSMGLDNPISLGQGQTFEGGDAYIHDGILYFGIGTRTSANSAIRVFNNLADELSQRNMRFIIVADTDHEARPLDEQMDFMHLDTFSMPLGPKQMLVCKEEVQRRTVAELSRNSGGVVMSHLGISFLDFLERNGDDLLIIPKEEQQTFGANLLAVDENTVLVPTESNAHTVTGLRNMGKNVINLNLIESTKGYGGPHCMTGQLLREAG